MILPDPVADENFCGSCGKEMNEPTWRRCGLRCCSLLCTRSHGEKCVRQWWHTPSFGERFSGKSFPLTKAVGLKGISTQPPLDYEVAGDQWDLRTVEGKARLDEQEAEGDLMWTHWAPSRITFLTDRRTGHWDWQGYWVDGTTKLRDRSHPEGLPKLRQHLNVSVRQANALAKRAARGTVEAGLLLSSIPTTPICGACQRLNLSKEKVGTIRFSRLAATEARESPGCAFCTTRGAAQAGL